MITKEMLETLAKAHYAAANAAGEALKNAQRTYNMQLTRLEVRGPRNCVRKRVLGVWIRHLRVLDHGEPYPKEWKHR